MCQMLVYKKYVFFPIFILRTFFLEILCKRLILDFAWQLNNIVDQPIHRAFDIYNHSIAYTFSNDYNFLIIFGTLFKLSVKFNFQLVNLSNNSNLNSADFFNRLGSAD
jgi:hypothetical protein